VTLPEVTAKVAMSLNGCIATQSGESQWITGPEARADGHGLRHTHDAILVGLGTVLADDPQLTCRLPNGRHPRPVILDSHFRIPASARVVGGPSRAIVITAHDAPERPELAVDVVRVRATSGGVSVSEALRALAEMGVTSVLVEGGAAVHRSMLDAGLVDRLVLYVAPKVIPGGRPWVGGSPLAILGSAPGFEVSDVKRIGSDVRLTLQRSPPGPETGPRSDECPVT
jgi:diaminohydroxyphosphoribosylaminopyrimidine deaminase/5-amino-6-(5-phosphoribosylamino)uracil reductase